MSKKLPDFADVLDESSLDEYGVWVKAGPDDSNESDGFVADLIDDRLDDLPAEDQEPGLSLPMDREMALQDPEPGSLPDSGITPKGQEVADMSEQDKTTRASLTESLEDQEISLDASEELALSKDDDDDLGGLSDLLLNIDEESDQDDTIYLEDDDLSFDLDEENEDLLLEQEAIDTQSGDDFSEDIVIPGLDDELSLDGDTNAISLPTDSLEGLDDFDAELNELDTAIAESDSAPVANKNIEVHTVEEVGLDEFLDEQLSTDAPKSDPELSLDDEINFDMEDSELDLTSEPINEIELDKKPPSQSSDSLNANFDSEASLDIDLGPEIDLDEDLIESDLNFSTEEIDDKLPGVETEVASIKSVLDTNTDDLPDLEPESGNYPAFERGFDDVAAVTADITEPRSANFQNGSSEILSSIEDELHAIRSELTDLRAELKKLRAKDSLETKDEILDLSTNDAEMDGINPENFENQNSAEEKVVPVGGGFFDDDEDETIALTGDELDNILNTAEFTEEAGEPSNPDLDEESVDLVGEDNNPVPVSAQEFTFSDSAEPDTTDATSPKAFEDATGNAEFAPIEEISLEEMPESSELSSDDDTSLQTPEDPSLVNNVVPAEAMDDVFVGSTKAMEQLAQLDIEKELAGIEDLKDDEDDIELYTGGELDSLELEIPEEFTDAAVMDDFEEIQEVETENSNTDQELAAPPIPSKTPTPSSDFSGAQPAGDEISFNLKQEIKAVLAYMDQLLESLPEEKIEEFARSEHFDVYKKLFDELGL